MYGERGGRVVKGRRVWTLVLVAALALGGYRVWSAWYSPAAQAAAAADRFWKAVVRGDAGAVTAMMAPEADFRAEDLIAQHEGFKYNGKAHIVKALTPNRTGVQFLAISFVVPPPYEYSHGRTLALKQAEGRWLVTRAGSGFSY